jgi:hypothetical protein
MPRGNVAATEGRPVCPELPTGITSCSSSSPTQATSRCLSLVIVLLAMTVINRPAEALVLDWTGRTWVHDSSQNTNSNSYETDASRTGDDVTISTNTAWPAEFGTPAVDQTLQGGNAPPNWALVFTPDSTRDTHTFTITITFSATYTQGVSNVSFTLFDIDSSGSLFIDQVRDISATSVTGTTIAPTITDLGSNVIRTGMGVNQVLTGNGLAPDTGAGSANGNATISFNVDGIRSITFTFGEPTGGPANPSQQNFGLSNINYSPVPEVNPTVAAVFVCLLGMLALKVHRLRITQQRAK